MSEVVTWGAIAVAVGSILSILKFWSSFSDRLAKSEAKAAAAVAIAQEAKAEAHEASEKITLLSTSFGLYREQIAREYINREAMREVEDRLTQAVDRLGVRLDRFTEAAIHKA